MRLHFAVTLITFLVLFIKQTPGKYQEYTYVDPTKLICIYIAHSIRPRTFIGSSTTLENVTIHTPSQRVTASTEFNLTFNLPGLQDGELQLNLEPNHDILGQSLHTRHINVNGEIRRTETVGRAGHKVFKGRAFIRYPGRGWEKAGWARIYMVQDRLKPLFEGSFSVFSQRYHVKVTSHEGASRMVVEHDFVSDIQSGNLLSRQTRVNGNMPIFRRQVSGPDNEDLISSIGNTDGCPTTRRVAVLGIATDCEYTASFDSPDDIRQNLISMVNTASEVFESTFNIALAVHNLTITDAACPDNATDPVPWNVACSAGIMEWRHQQFTNWRGSLSDTTNAYWTLMSGCPTEQQVGISWNGALCDPGRSTNVVAQNDWQVFA